MLALNFAMTTLKRVQFIFLISMSSNQLKKKKGKKKEGTTCHHFSLNMQNFLGNYHISYSNICVSYKSTE